MHATELHISQAVLPDPLSQEKVYEWKFSQFVSWWTQ